jgi:hypothetical protein
MHDWCYNTANCPMYLEYFVPYVWKCYRRRPLCGQSDLHTYSFFLVHFNKMAATGDKNVTVRCELDQYSDLCLVTTDFWKHTASIFMAVSMLRIASHTNSYEMNL